MRRKRYLYERNEEFYGVTKNTLFGLSFQILQRMNDLSFEQINQYIADINSRRSLYIEPVSQINLNKDSLIAELTNKLLDSKYKYLDIYQSLQNALSRITELGVLLNSCVCDGGKSFSSQMEIDLTVNTSIKEEYVLYIMKHGMPNDGVFLPTLLEEIRQEMLNS